MKGILMVLAMAVSGTGLARGVDQGDRERALIAYMKVQPGTEEQFLDAAQDVIRTSRNESGNIMYQLHQSVTDPQTFVFYELFASDADLQYHRNSPHVKAFLEATKSITVQFTLEEYQPEGRLQR